MLTVEQRSQLETITNDEQATRDEVDAAVLLLMGTPPDAHLAAVVAGWVRRNGFKQDRYGK